MSPRRFPRLLAPVALLLAGTLSAQSPCGPLSVEITSVPSQPQWFSVLLEDVTTLPDGRAFAVGHYTEETSLFDNEDFTLAMHWDGSAWHHVPTPSPSPYPGGTYAQLHGVDALAPDDVWAGGGAVGDAGGLSVGTWPMVQHWDGGSWELVPVPEPPGGVSINFSGPRVLAVEALSSDDVWFGGLWGEPNQIGSVTWRPMAMHWDGSDLSMHDTPAVFDGYYGFQSVSFSALASDDIWAACRLMTASAASKKTVLMHWDGSEWSLVDVPDSTVSHRTQEVVALASDDVWVFGSTYSDNSGFALHFDGSSWTEVSGTPRTQAAASLGNSSFLVGETTLELFDGSSSTVLDPLTGFSNVSFWGMTSSGPCEGWAVGRAALPGEGLEAFAVRVSAPGGTTPWTTVGNGLAGLHGVPTLTGEGSLSGGTPVALDVGGARENAAAMLVMGFTELMAPFKGGVLVPSPDAVFTGLATDATGAFTLAGTWPGGVANGASFTSQLWVADAAAPKGLAATNGLRGTSP